MRNSKCVYDDDISLIIENSSIAMKNSLKQKPTMNFCIKKKQVIATFSRNFKRRNIEKLPKNVLFEEDSTFYTKVIVINVLKHFQ